MAFLVDVLCSNTTRHCSKTTKRQREVTFTRSATSQRKRTRRRRRPRRATIRRSAKKAMKAMMIIRIKRLRSMLLCSINKRMMRRAKRRSLTSTECGH